MSKKVIQSIAEQHANNGSSDHEKNGGVSICQEGVEVTSEVAQKVQFTVSKEYLALFEPELAKEDIERTMELDARAEDWVEKGNNEKAIELYENILYLRQKSFYWGHPNVAITLAKLAKLHQQNEQFNLAEMYYEKSLKMLQMIQGKDHPIVAAALHDLGCFYSIPPLPQYAHAEGFFRRSLAILEKYFGPNHFYVAELVTRVADACNSQEHFDEAESFYKRALAIYEDTLPSDHPDIATALHALAYLHDVQGNYDQAYSFYERAFKIDKSVFNPVTFTGALCLENLAKRN
jgi:tetratricopeptide (TPR) repeat protein